jgi:hypothetical protein
MDCLKVVNKPAGYSLDTTVELTKTLATLKCQPFTVIHTILLNIEAISFARLYAACDKPGAAYASPSCCIACP